MKTFETPGRNYIKYGTDKTSQRQQMLLEIPYQTIKNAPEVQID
jgi:hypothetical protein